MARCWPLYQDETHLASRIHADLVIAADLGGSGRSIEVLVPRLIVGDFWSLSTL